MKSLTPFANQPQAPEPSRDADVRPFSNHTEYEMWYAANCERCALNGYIRGGDVVLCPMEEALSIGTLVGTVPAALAEQYGAKISEQPGFCTMPRQCSRFAPSPTCEWVSWPGTRRRRKCGDVMVATVDANGYTRAVCARHLKRFAAEHPEKAPVLVVDKAPTAPTSWSTPDEAVTDVSR